MQNFYPQINTNYSLAIAERGKLHF